MELKVLDYVLVPVGLVGMVAYNVWLLHQIVKRPTMTVIGINAINCRFWVRAMMESFGGRSTGEFDHIEPENSRFTISNGGIWQIYGFCAQKCYLSSILGQDGPEAIHKCDWKCENEHICGNIYRCKLTGLTHICDKNCNQGILYDNHSSLCRVSRQISPLTPAEEHAVKGVRRKLDAESSPPDSFAFKRRREAQFHPSPFERSFSRC